MSHKLNSAIAVIGIDIGKNSFHAVGQDKRGESVLRQKWSRGEVEARTDKTHSEHNESAFGVIATKEGATAGF